MHHVERRPSADEKGTFSIMCMIVIFDLWPWPWNLT